MKNFLLLSAAIATIVTIGFAGYGLGQSSSSSSSGAVEVTINNAISNLPQNKQGLAKELLEPILEIVQAENSGSLNTDENSIKQYGERLKVKLEEFSLIPYQADKSPFVPPKMKTQFFCDNQFRFSYKGLGNKNSVEEIRFTVEGITHYLNIGTPRKFQSDDKVLEIVYLSYGKKQKGPILQYICLDK